MISNSLTLAVIGLGYVGLPVAVAFARSGIGVVGFDIDVARVAELRRGHDRTHEVAAADLALGGHAVRLAVWPGAEASLVPIERRGGLEVRGDAAHLVSGRLGLAKVQPMGLPDAVRGALGVVLHHRHTIRTSCHDAHEREINHEPREHSRLRPVGRGAPR